MWKIVLELSIVLLIALLLTQVMIPIIFNGQIFWLFRKSKNPIEIKEKPEKDKSFDATIDYLAKQKARTEEERQKIENEIKEKINKVNNLNK